MEDKDWYPRLNVPLDPEVRAALEALAQREIRPVGRMAELLIRDALERRDLLPHREAA